MFSVIYGLTIFAVFALSLKNQDKAFYLFVLILPFYTILREMSNGSIFFFLWPYAMITVFMFQIIFMITEKRLTFKQSDIITFAEKYIWRALCILFIVYYLVLFLQLGNIPFFFKQDLSNFILLLTDSLIVLLIIPVIFFNGYFFYLYFKVMKLREGCTNLLDVFVALFYAYGFIHVFLAFAKNYDMFNSIVGYRYYFVMSLLYFISRHIIKEDKQLKILSIIGVMIFLAAACFMLLETMLLNYFGVAPSSLPWSGFLLEKFDYTYDTGSIFLETNYMPRGIMYMQHLSGLFTLMGFTVYLPVIIIATKLQSPLKQLAVWLLLLFLPLSFIFTSKMVLILYVLVLITFSIIFWGFWRRIILIVTIFGILIPYSYSYHLLPGMTFDITRVASYIINKHTATNETQHNLDKLTTQTGITGNLLKESETRNLDGWFHNKADVSTRILPNVLVNTFKLIIKDIELTYNHKCIETENRDSNQKALAKSRCTTSFSEKIIFGSGYAETDWFKLFKTSMGSYRLSTESDTPYLNFFVQFGIVGLFSLIGIGIIGIFQGFASFFRESNHIRKALLAGNMMVIIVSFASMMHLQSLFKTGLNSIIFVMLAIAAYSYGTNKMKFNLTNLFPFYKPEELTIEESAQLLEGEKEKPYKIQPKVFP